MATSASQEQRQALEQWLGPKLRDHLARGGVELDNHASQRVIARILNSSTELLVEPRDREDRTYETIKISAGGQSSSFSVKRLKLSWANLVTIAAGVSNAVTRWPSKWGVALVVLGAINTLHKTLGLQLTEVDTAVVWALWDPGKPDPYPCLDEPTILASANKELGTHAFQKIDEPRLKTALDRLDGLKIVKRDPSSGCWRLVEDVELDV
jgi:hypothetical protein